MAKEHQTRDDFKTWAEWTAHKVKVCDAVIATYQAKKAKWQALGKLTEAQAAASVQILALEEKLAALKAAPAK